MKRTIWIYFKIYSARACSWATAIPLHPLALPCSFECLWQNVGFKIPLEQLQPYRELLLWDRHNLQRTRRWEDRGHRATSPCASRPEPFSWGRLERQCAGNWLYQQLEGRWGRGVFCVKYEKVNMNCAWGRGVRFHGNYSGPWILHWQSGSL